MPPCLPVAWHPNGVQYAVACADIICLKFFEIESKIEQYTLSDRLKRNRMSSDYVFQIAWSPCGRRIASCSAHGYIRIWDCEMQRLLMLILLEGHTGGVLGVSWNSESQLASCGGWEWVARVGCCPCGGIGLSSGQR